MRQIEEKIETTTHTYGVLIHIRKRKEKKGILKRDGIEGVCLE